MSGDGIDPATVQPGDQVLIIDRHSPAEAFGYVNLDQNTGTLWLRAFGVRIDFARHTAAGWHKIGGITVQHHQPPLPFGDLQ